MVLFLLLHEGPAVLKLFSTDNSISTKMTHRQSIFLTLVLAGCISSNNKPTDKVADSLEAKDAITSVKEKVDAKNNPFPWQHFQDTTYIRGEFVVFLRPDSIRFEYYANEDENIYDADSDFGFGISATIDSMERNEKYKDVHTTVSDKRYILIEDCKNCPRIID